MSTVLDLGLLIRQVGTSSVTNMYQQYLNKAQSSLAGLSSEELKELINDDEKLENRVNDVVTFVDSILRARRN